MKRKYLIASLIAAALAVGGIPAASVVSSAADASGIAGDVNGDGAFSVLDTVQMQKWLLSTHGTTLANPLAGDMNADGTLDVFDLALMKRQLLNGSGSSDPVKATDGSVITFTDGAVTVSDDAGNAVTEHPAIRIDGQTVTITQPGEYTVSGNSENGQLIVDVDASADPEAKVTLNLTGLNLSNPSAAPIYVANAGDSCVISVKKNTVNTISDGT